MSEEKTKTADKWAHLKGWITIRDETAFRKFADEYSKMIAELHPNAIWHPAMPDRYPVLMQPVFLPNPNGPVSFTAVLGVNDAVTFLHNLGLQVVRPQKNMQDEFNRSMAANVLSLVEVMISKGMIAEDSYTRKLQANLATVDQWNAQDTDTRKRIAKAVDGSGPVLDGFYPKQDE